MCSASSKVSVDLASDESLELGIRLTRGARRLIRDLVRTREQRGYSRSQIADAIGIHKSGVTRFEQQESDPRLATVLRYAHAVGAEVTFGVEPLGGWDCENSTVLVRLNSWRSGNDIVDDADSWYPGGRVESA